jgi:hypothetical protein
MTSVLSATGAYTIREYFDPIPSNLDGSFIEFAEKLERDARVEDHPFFSAAKRSRQLLVLWAGQEAIVTNPFSQILFRVIGSIRNVHVRSLLLPVVGGEHSAVRKGIAEKSHPWLIWRLCVSLGLSEQEITPTKAVVEFIHALEATEENPMRALGALGVGNEQMLLAEYRAVEACFDMACPDADYRDFLHANIAEDETHTKLISNAAIALTACGYQASDYIIGARQGVAARIQYYDSLLGEMPPTATL